MIERGYLNIRRKDFRLMAKNMLSSSMGNNRSLGRNFRENEVLSPVLIKVMGSGLGGVME